jgi:hypothetical protein
MTASRRTRETANPAISGFPKPSPIRWFERVSAATSFYAAFRPLFRRVAPLVHGYTLLTTNHCGSPILRRRATYRGKNGHF